MLLTNNLCAYRKKNRWVVFPGAEFAAMSQTSITEKARWGNVKIKEVKTINLEKTHVFEILGDYKTETKQCLFYKAAAEWLKSEGKCNSIENFVKRCDSRIAKNKKEATKIKAGKDLEAQNTAEGTAAGYITQLQLKSELKKAFGRNSASKYIQAKRFVKTFGKNKGDKGVKMYLPLSKLIKEPVFWSGADFDMLKYVVLNKDAIDTITAMSLTEAF